MDDVQWWTVRTPVRLVEDTTVPVGAKALYFVLLDHRQPDTWECRKPQSELAELAGIRSAATVAAHLRKLAEAGWLDIHTCGRQPLLIKLRPFYGETTVNMPGMLVGQRHLSAAAKCLYALLLMRRDPRTGLYQGRYHELFLQRGLHSAEALQSAVSQLQQAGWLRLRSRSGAGGRTYEPLDPHLQMREAVVERLHVRLDRKTSLGEALLQAMLTECISDQAYEDNARLNQIKNPLTGEPLEFDRLYEKAQVAIEFNGPQHYMTTEKFPDPAELFAQQARDLIKEAQARRHGITLVIVDPHELSFQRIAVKLRELLPVRPVRREDPVVRELERLSRAYRKKL